ncbi:MAG: ribulose-phosphate 3-epimerase [Muribaculaceae bacterium]|nr:ribulose-phosphate 3-epimerase [Muribaculaceae bacterium]
MKVSPSLLSANFANLTPEIEMINKSSADYLHIDVMDGVFVPNISFGFPVIKAVEKVCEKPLDVHLMIVEPDKWISQVRDCGAWLMNVHYEACTHLNSTVSRIHQAGMKAGVTLNPSTPVAMLEDIIEDVDLVLLMSVNPGFGGQAFIPNSIKKTRQLRHLIESTGSKALIEVDGGVNESTGKELASAGADILVAGSYVFGAQDPIERINILKSICK